MQITETRDGLGGMVPLCTRSSSLRRRDPDQVLRVTASPVERDQRNLSPLSGPPLDVVIVRPVRRKVNVCRTLNRLQRNIQFCIAANNAATVADIDLQVTFKHAVWQRPTVVGTEPESQEMASTFDLGPILESGACV